MSEAMVDDIVAVLPPLLQSLEALAFIARHLNPPDFDKVMEAAGSRTRPCRRSVRGFPTGRSNSPICVCRC
jgi:phospholipase/carboxylesterase